MKFSERKGYRVIDTTIQKDELREVTRNLVWNVLHEKIWATKEFNSKNPLIKSEYKDFDKAVWGTLYKRPLDEIPSHDSFMSYIRGDFFNSDIHGVYDLLEFILDYFNHEQITAEVNLVLEKEFVGYRVVQGLVTDITDEQEVTMLNEAFVEDDFPSVRIHLTSAFEKLTNRETPDYRNSIKESISAVESLAKQITGNPNATLGEALKVLGLEGKVHPALKEGWLKLYGYASDGDGIRHGLMEKDNLTADDAKYFLLTSTSFINYLKTKI